MIKYRKGLWGVSFIFQREGSVLPKAFMWAFPSGGGAALINYFYLDVLGGETGTYAARISTVFAGATFVLGFLVVFRSQQAYSRYWEGATLLREIRGEWLNATSSLIAFCTTDKARRDEVEAYQHLLVRLVSMLHSCALQTVAEMDNAQFDRFSVVGIEESSLDFLGNLEDKRHRCEVLTQWTQRHICNGISKGLVTIAPPILSRVYQEISLGVVKLSNARKLTEIPFPFPIAQMLQTMLMAYIAITPTIAGLILESKVWAAVLTFCAVFSFTGVNYISMEIESPFGEDRNDLPLHDMQEEMNNSLWLLLDKRAQEVPLFTFNKDIHRIYSQVRSTVTRSGSETPSDIVSSPSFKSRVELGILDRLPTTTSIVAPSPRPSRTQGTNSLEVFDTEPFFPKSDPQALSMAADAVQEEPKARQNEDLNSHEEDGRRSGEAMPDVTPLSGIAPEAQSSSQPSLRPGIKEDRVAMLEVTPIFSLDQRLDQSLAALRASLILHTSSMVDVLRQEIQQTSPEALNSLRERESL